MQPTSTAINSVHVGKDVISDFSDTQVADAKFARDDSSV